MYVITEIIEIVRMSCLREENMGDEFIAWPRPFYEVISRNFLISSVLQIYKAIGIINCGFWRRDMKKCIINKQCVCKMFML